MLFDLRDFGRPSMNILNKKGESRDILHEVFLQPLRSYFIDLLFCSTERACATFLKRCNSKCRRAVSVARVFLFLLNCFFKVLYSLLSNFYGAFSICKGTNFAPFSKLARARLVHSLQGNRLFGGFSFFFNQMSSLRI